MCATLIMRLSTEIVIVWRHAIETKSETVIAPTNSRHRTIFFFHSFFFMSLNVGACSNNSLRHFQLSTDAVCFIYFFCCCYWFLNIMYGSFFCMCFSWAIEIILLVYNVNFIYFFFRNLMCIKLWLFSFISNTASDFVCSAHN